DVEMVAGTPDADDFNASNYALHLRDRIEHADGDRITHRSPLIVVDSLMDHAHHVRLVGIPNLDGEGALRVGLGACFLLQVLIQVGLAETALVQIGLVQAKKNHFRTSHEPAASLIADHARDGIRGHRLRGTVGNEADAQDDLPAPKFLSPDTAHRPPFVGVTPTSRKHRIRASTASWVAP